MAKHGLEAVVLGDVLVLLSAELVDHLGLLGDQRLQLDPGPPSFHALEGSHSSIETLRRRTSRPPLCHPANRPRSPAMNRWPPTAVTSLNASTDVDEFPAVVFDNPDPLASRCHRGGSHAKRNRSSDEAAGIGIKLRNRPWPGWIRLVQGVAQ